MQDHSLPAYCHPTPVKPTGYDGSSSPVCTPLYARVGAASFQTFNTRNNYGRTLVMPFYNRLARSRMDNPLGSIPACYTTDATSPAAVAKDGRHQGRLSGVAPSVLRPVPM